MKLEELFSVKEKEITCLTDNIQRSNAKCSKQEKELQDLKKENGEIKLQIGKNVDSIAKLRHGDNAKEQIHDENEEKFIKINEDIAVLNKTNSGQLKKIEADVHKLFIQLNKTVNEETHRNRFETLREKCNTMEKQVDGIENINNNMNNISTEWNAFHQKVIIMEKKVVDVGNVMDELNALITKLDQFELNYDNFQKEILGMENVKEKLEALSDENKEVENQCKIIEEHVANLENIQFSKHTNEEVLIQWKVTNLSFCKDEDKDFVTRPVFYTTIEGYAFEFATKVKFSIHCFELLINVHRSRSFDELIGPYNTPVSLELVANDGSVISKKVSENDFESLELPDGSDFGPSLTGSVFFRVNNTEQYILNDAVTYQCRFNLL